MCIITWAAQTNLHSIPTTHSHQPPAPSLQVNESVAINPAKLPSEHSKELIWFIVTGSQWKGTSQGCASSHGQPNPICIPFPLHTAINLRHHLFKSPPAKLPSEHSKELIGSSSLAVSGRAHRRDVHHHMGSPIQSAFNSHYKQPSTSGTISSSQRVSGNNPLQSYPQNIVRN